MFTAPDVLCPFHSYDYDSKNCYKLSTNSMDGEQAHTFCREIGGSLISIKYKKDQEIVKKTLGLRSRVISQNSKFWIDLTRNIKSQYGMSFYIEKLFESCTNLVL